MSELRAEVKTLRQNEAAAERADIITLQKELDSLNQKTREDLENLRNDVTIEMNNRKLATRAEQQAMEVKIQDLNYNFTKRLADMRTETEAQKWRTTRLLISPSQLSSFNSSNSDHVITRWPRTIQISPKSEGCLIRWKWGRGTGLFKIVQQPGRSVDQRVTHARIRIVRMSDIARESRVHWPGLDKF
jgi:Coiled-coil domain-containing protein 90-like